METPYSAINHTDGAGPPSPLLASGRAPSLLSPGAAEILGVNPVEASIGLLKVRPGPRLAAWPKHQR